MQQNLIQLSKSLIPANPEEEAEENLEALYLGPPYPWEIPWAGLLPIFPSLQTLAKWDEINVDEWPRLLGLLPELEHRCPLHEFLGNHWADLLLLRPALAHLCDWDLLIGSDWAKLLGGKPQFAERCPWARLRSVDWLRLLTAQAQFSDRCPWEEIRRPGISIWELREEWIALLRRDLHFAHQCPPDMLTHEDWLKLSPVKLFDFGVESMPDPEMQSYWNCRQWMAALENNPKLLPKCPWKLFTSAALLVVLTEFPEHSHRCDLARLESRHWRQLLCLKPEYGQRCPWASIRFTPGDWLQLLEHEPQFAIHCPWDWQENELSPHQWLPLIRRRPEFAGRWSLLQEMLTQAQEASR